LFRSLYLDCATCGDERLFERPPCVDGHSEECPDLACTECGMAIVIGDLPRVPVTRARPQPAPTRYQAA
jgi:DNA-directed RNA polymerase subunit RPC12/RpoP